MGLILYRHFEPAWLKPS